MSSSCASACVLVSGVTGDVEERDPVPGVAHEVAVTVGVPAQGRDADRRSPAGTPSPGLAGDDVVLRAEGEAGDVLGAVVADDEDVVLAVAAGARLPSGTVIIGSIDTTMPGSSTVSMSSRSSSPASRP